MFWTWEFQRQHPFTAWSLDAFGPLLPFDFTNSLPASGLTLGADSFLTMTAWVYAPVSTGGRVLSALRHGADFLVTFEFLANLT
ncbi:MAG: hypothetical protein Q8J76_13530 [Desulfobulbaceae bacterium]|nr:hypothetical protein [Desulfobulbaceae bacterium]